MSGGGGGGGGMHIQDNSLQVEAMRQQAARDEQARQDAEKARLEQEFNVNLGNAVTGARQTGLDYAGSRGLDPTSMESVIDRIINDTKLKVPKGDSSPGQYFTSDAFSTGFANEEQNRRATNTGKVNSVFAPGFDRGLISDTSDDPILDAILGEQRATAEQQLQFNRARGVINDTGYNTAQQRFGGQEAAARSTLTSIGDAVLGTLRGGLNDIKGEAGSAGSSWSLGNPEFSVDPYKQRADEFATSGKAGLEGKVRSAVGSTQLFDIPGILAAAGTAQGPINFTTVNKVDGTPGFDPKKSRNNRGLGSTGEF
jgi:hypothetical protein